MHGKQLVKSCKTKLMFEKIINERCDKVQNLIKQNNYDDLTYYFKINLVVLNFHKDLKISKGGWNSKSKKNGGHKLNE